jgi:hypothetical protein
LIALVNRNLFTVWALQAHSGIRHFRFISNPRERIKKWFATLRIYFTVGEFLVAFRAAQNPSRHFEISSVSSNDRKRSLGLGMPMETQPQFADNTRNHVLTTKKLEGDVKLPSAYP